LDLPDDLANAEKMPVMPATKRFKKGGEVEEEVSRRKSPGLGSSNQIHRRVPDGVFQAVTLNDGERFYLGVKNKAPNSTPSWSAPQSGSLGLTGVAYSALRDQGSDSPIVKHYSLTKNPCFVTCANSALCSYS
jgi:hypothetical protein